MEWISVKDRLPELGKGVLMCWGNSEENISVGRYCRNVVRGKILDRWYWHNKLASWKITHWMELPNPPEVEK